jgi:hypothetical protein
MQRSRDIRVASEKVAAECFVRDSQTDAADPTCLMFDLDN